MSMIRDMMPGFELFQPATAQDAVALLERYGDDGWALAGGLDTFDWLKDRIKRPRAVIDLGAIESLRGVREASGGGLEIGAMTTLTEVSNNAEVKKSYALLAKAAGLVATPQIRNQGTIGGNVCQDTRCWYYRGGWPCYRAGGNICYADTPASMNREHCVFGASRCVAVNPSDTAGALVALDASMVVLGRGGEKVVKAEEFFIGPAVDITRMTVLRPGEMLTAIRLPAEWAGAHYYFEKARDRQSWDFALVSVAAAMKVEGGTVRDVRLVCNSVAPYPVRLKAAEAQVRGKAVIPDSPDRTYHQARIGAKNLRYAAEAIGPFVARRAGRVQNLAVAATAVQDVLGAHQDALVMQHQVEETRHVHRKDAAFAFAAGRYAERLDARRRDLRAAYPKVRDELLERIKRWGRG